MAKKRGNPNWINGQGGGPKSSKLVVAVRDIPGTIDKIVGGYLQWRDAGIGPHRAESKVIRETFDISSTTLSKWRSLSAEGKQPYREMFDRIAAAEKLMRMGLFKELDPALREQPYRYLEKKFPDWRDHSIDSEALEARAQQIANDKIVLLAGKISQLVEVNPTLGAAELLTGALELLADQES